MSTPNKSRYYAFVVYVLWALFVNALNVWVISPLVEDYALLGVVGVVLIALVWLSSIPAVLRKKWVVFTLFSLLLGQGFSSLTFYPLPRRILFGIIMFVGLYLIAWLFGKIGAKTLFLSGLVVVLANSLLPISEWPFLTHFRMTHFGSYNIVPGDMVALPFSVITTDHGQAVVTLKRSEPSKSELKQIANQATDSPSALGDVLGTYKDEYQLVELSSVKGKLEITDPTSADLAKVNPFDLIGPSFPFSLAHYLKVNNQVVQYMTPALPAQAVTGLGMETAMYPTNMVVLSEAVRQAEWNIWQQFLNGLGVSPVAQHLQVTSGYLVGQVNGQHVHIAVNGTAYVSTGSFTAAGTSEALVEGANLLEVVDLNSKKVVASYRGQNLAFVPGDLVTGPLTKNGKDAIFVNATPAYILQVSQSGQFKKIYVAPNDSLRFEASIQFVKNQAPEIITDDPSVIRQSPIRYLSSYTYSNGNLERNWRVYRTNVVNVTPIQFTRGSVPELVIGIYGTGEYLVLQRNAWPVMPLAIVIFGISIVFGWILCLRGRKRQGHA
jgi:hypothetical protein